MMDTLNAYRVSSSSSGHVRNEFCVGKEGEDIKKEKKLIRKRLTL